MDIELKRKRLHPVSERLRGYLRRHSRSAELPIGYSELLGFRDSFPLYDREGNDTGWQSFVYEPTMWSEISAMLAKTYAMLKAGNTGVTRHLRCDRVDFCAFGNSQPFRIRIVNNYNDNHDYFYIKRADASRIYGLELEDLISPNSMNFVVHGDTLVEQHIIGIPGDMFVRDYFHRDDLNRVRIAKEFVKFNERCFIRLLGDMRSYNYVIRMTPDFEDRQYRVRAIDFDQQSYEGRHRFYFPQFFRDNREVVDMCLTQLEPESIEQYREEERSLIARRAASFPYRLQNLRIAMCNDLLSDPEKIEQLRNELARYYGDDRFLRCESMGDLTFSSIDLVLERSNSGRAEGLDGR